MTEKKSKKSAVNYHVPARSGKGFEVKKGDLLKIIDLKGQQAVDFWAFNKENPKEFLSCEHTKVLINKVIPIVGDSAHTNQRRPIVTVVEDNSPGQHDMQAAACDRFRYQRLGAQGYHANCLDNLHAALKDLGIDFDFTPQPWNLFTNFIINSDGTLTLKATETKSGDNIVLRAEMTAYIVVSACPQDIAPTNANNPTDIQVDVWR